jgi:hypothetical protein
MQHQLIHLGLQPVQVVLGCGRLHLAFQFMHPLAQHQCAATHAGTKDADARLFEKSEGDKSRLCHMGRILMENRNGLIVDVDITHASGTAEREAALAMLERRCNRSKQATVGAGKGYDDKAFCHGSP